MKQQLFGEIVLQYCPQVTEEQLQKAFEIREKSKEPLGQVLVNMGLITEKERVMCLGKQWGVPFVDLQEYPINKEIVRKIPRRVLERHRVIPIEMKDKQIILAMANPLDIFVMDEVRLITGCEVEPVIATEEDIVRAINDALGVSELGETVGDLVRGLKVDDVSVESAKEEEDVGVEQLKALAEEAPVVRLSHMIMSQAVHQRASDVHIQPEADRLRVRYRVDGVLYDAMELPKYVQSSLVSRFKIMAETDIAEKRVPQDGRFSLTVSRKKFDVRLSTYPSGHGEKVVMRLLDMTSVKLGVRKLGMPSKMLEDWNRLAHSPYGIVLVTGPTGSGKSTTLYSTLSELNTPDTNIMTIEDPIEYWIPGITQAQVNPLAGMTFARALRAMLRQDPNIILVGEIRDRETAVTAIEAALTGHLVFSTLHTNDAPSAVTRLIEMGVEPFLISSSVIGVLAQRLVRTICPKCKEEYASPSDAFRRLGLTKENQIKLNFYRGKGCKNCRNTGYSGRIGVFELMVVNDTIRDLILKAAPAYVIREAAVEAGMITLHDDVIQKILQGLTTVSEALNVVFID